MSATAAARRVSWDPSDFVLSRRTRRAATALCFAVALALAATYMTLVRSGDVRDKRADFISYYSAARLILQGHGSHLYDFASLGHLERSLVRPLTVRNGVLPFMYPPYAAVLLAPISALPYGAAYVVWLALNGALLIVCLAALGRIAAVGGEDRLLFTLGAASLIPVSVALLQGQISIVLLGLFIAFYLVMRAGRTGWAGASLALALVKPPILVPVVLFLVLHRHWRVLAGFTATAVGLVMVPTILLGPSGNSRYIQTLISAIGWHRQFGYAPQWSHSLWSFFQLLLPTPAASVGAGLACLALLATLAAACLHWQGPARPDVEGQQKSAPGLPSWDLAFALSLVAGLLISPHLLIHDLTLVLLPVALAARHRALAPSSLAAVLGAGYLALFIGPELVSRIPIQLSVLALLALSVWLIRSLSLRSVREVV